MKQKVLITGGSGLLALNWALAIRENYSVVLGLHERWVELSGLETCLIDLVLEDELVRTLKTMKPHIVIHSAGLTNVEQCEDNPSLARITNVDIAENLAKACAQLDLPMVHISTDHLFVGDVPLVGETYPVSPINTYGCTKAEAELKVQAAHPASIVIRTNFYGWGPSYRQSFSDVVISALRAGKELTLFEDVFYTPIIIETLVSTTQALIGRQASGIFNVVGDERISKYEFGIKVAKKFSLDAKLIKRGLLAHHAGLVKRPYDMSLSNLKVCNILGRKLGGVDQHLDILYQQEQSGFAQEIQQR